MQKDAKQAVVDDVKDLFGRMSSAVFLDYGGMNVEEVSDLRIKFRERGVTYRVVKNTLIKHAVSGESYSDALGPVLKGMTAIAWSFEEPSAAARVVKAYRKDNEKLEIKGGLLDGEVLDGKAVENQLATLPSKDEARATLLATLMAPAQQLVMLLNTPAGNLVRLLKAKESNG